MTDFWRSLGYTALAMVTPLVVTVYVAFVAGCALAALLWPVLTVFAAVFG